MLTLVPLQVNLEVPSIVSNWSTLMPNLTPIPGYTPELLFVRLTPGDPAYAGYPTYGICSVPNAPTSADVASTLVPPLSNPVAFSSKALSDSPPTPTVSTTPAYSPTAQNAVHVVNVSGVFGVVKNPA